MLARRAPGILKFLRLPCRWTSGGPPPPLDGLDFLTAADFEKVNEFADSVPVSEVDSLLDPKNPPDLSFQQYRRLKAIDFSERDKLQAARRQEKHDEWQAELDAMRKATETGFSTPSQDLDKIKSHTLQSPTGVRETSVQMADMPLSKEGIAASLSGEMTEATDVPMQDYFNVNLFPEALDAGKWLPKRVKGKCIFCTPDPSPRHIKNINFTNVQLLHAFINERGMITSRRWNSNCKKHQRAVAKAVRRARVLGFLSPTDNFFAPESFANTSLDDLAKLANSQDMKIYGVGMATGARRARPTVAMDAWEDPPVATDGEAGQRVKPSFSDVIG